ncbi:MAG TPA: helix-hairpin-helix domain-containing protein [Phycisphaerae bacterium]|nr:helix-hairpin-helix domain-containing protein [Phycisphaerae bacterium]
MNEAPAQGWGHAWPKPVYWVCYGILALILAYVLVLGWLRPVYLAEPIGVIPGAAAQIEQKINPNTATWAELTQLPRIGPALAKRIVAYRHEQQTASAATQPVFLTPDDLDAVRGIGPKTVDRMRPFLTFEDN